jgi:cell wall-associated NlpC family hydrolase
MGTDARARRRAAAKRIEAERAGAPRALYDQVRDRIRTGDLILFRGRGPLSRLIRKLSYCVYSHVGIAAWWGDHLVVFQSRIPVGVEVLPARRVVWKYDGQVDWWALKPEPAARLDRDGLLSVAIAELGKPYSFWGLVRAGFRLLGGRLTGRRDPVALPESYFCSQFVSACFRGGGVDLAPDVNDECTSPGSIVRGGLVEMRAVLRRPR